MISGEALQSAFHFGLNLFLVHRLSAHDYGVFAITMVIGGLSLTYIRALTGMPASIWMGQSRNRPSVNGYDVMFGSAALVVSLIIGIIVATILQLWVGIAAASGGLFIALWSLRSYLRTALFARSWQRTVAAGDLSFALAGATLTAFLALGGQRNLLQTAFLLLALANALGILVTVLVAQITIRVSFRRQTRRRYARQWRQLGWSSVSASMANLQGQGMALLVATVAGPTAYAPIAAALLLFVPLRLLSVTVVNMIQPDLAARLADGLTVKTRQQMLLWTAVMLCCGLLYGAAVIVALPLMRIQAFDGAPVYVLGYLAWSIQIVCLLYATPRCVLEAAKAFRTLAMINTVGAIVGLCATALALLVLTPAWALAGALISEATVLIACWKYVVIHVPKSRLHYVTTVS